MSLTLRELVEIACRVRDFPSLPKAVLVVAGNRAQFNFWVHAYQAPNAVYLHSPHQLRGLGPQHVERIDFIGTWWTSDVFRDHASMERLARLHAEVCGDPFFPLRMYGEALRSAELCRCSADGGGCYVCAAMEGEHTERPHFVRLDVRSPTVGKGELFIGKISFEELEFTARWKKGRKGDAES